MTTLRNFVTWVIGFANIVLFILIFAGDVEPWIFKPVLLFVFGAGSYMMLRAAWRERGT